MTIHEFIVHTCHSVKTLFLAAYCKDILSSPSLFMSALNYQIELLGSIPQVGQDSCVLYFNLWMQFLAHGSPWRKDVTVWWKIDTYEAAMSNFFSSYLGVQIDHFVCAKLETSVKQLLRHIFIVLLRQFYFPPWTFTSPSSKLWCQALVTCWLVAHLPYVSGFRHLILFPSLRPCDHYHNIFRPGSR